MAKKQVSGSRKPTDLRLGEEASSWKRNEAFLPYFTKYIQSKTKQIQTKSQDPTQANEKHIYGRVRVFLTHT